MKDRITKILMVVAILSFGVFGTAYSQGKGKSTPDKGKVTQQQDRDKTQDRDRTQDPDRDMDRDQDRDRIRLDDKQLDQLRDRIKLTDQTRDRVKLMVRDYDGAAFTAAQGKENHMRIREQVRNMEQEHQRFMNGLDPKQKQRWEKRIMNMEQRRERIENRLQLMEEEMNKGQFDRIRQRTWAHEIEKAIKEWREQYHKMEHEGAGN